VEATLFHIKSAGRTRKGVRRDTNCDYICNFEFTVRDAEHGFYAVADGSMSTRNGERASEVAVQTLCSAIKATPESAGSLDALITNANKALVRERNGFGPDDSFVSSLVCGCLENGTLHVAVAGNGAAYIIQNKRIQRLTENQKVSTLDDPGLNREHASKGLLGLNDGACFFSKTDVRLLSGDSVVFCSDGLAERLDSVAILEIVASTETPEQTAAALLDKAAERGAADDTSVVVVRATRPRETQTRFINGISYPTSVRAAKYLITLALLATLAAMIHFFHIGAKLEPPSPSATNGKAASVNIFTKQPNKIIAPPAWTPEVLPQGAVTDKAVLFINSTPPGATVTIDGNEISQATPVRVTVEAKHESVIEFSMAGYLTKRTRAIVQEQGVEETVSATLQPVPDRMGGLEIKCAPACDDLLIDGAPAGGIARPFRSARINSSAGQHTLDAVHGISTRSRTVSIAENELSEVEFLFGDGAAAAPAAAPAPNNATPAPAPKPVPKQAPKPKATPKIEVVKPSSGGAVSKTQPTAQTSADNPAYVTVQATAAGGAIPGCRVMFFQGGRLAATGTSGAPVKIEPGSYLVKVSRDGFTTYEMQKYIGAGSQTLTVFLSSR
jgi:protein phosphatase